MVKFNALKYLKEDGTQGIPTDYSYVESLTNKSVLARKTDNGIGKHMIVKPSRDSAVVKNVPANISPYIELGETLRIHPGAKFYYPNKKEKTNEVIGTTTIPLYAWTATSSLGGEQIVSVYYTKTDKPTTSDVVYSDTTLTNSQPIISVASDYQSLKCGSIFFQYDAIRTSSSDTTIEIAEYKYNPLFAEEILTEEKHIQLGGYNPTTFIVCLSKNNSIELINTADESMWSSNAEPNLESYIGGLWYDLTENNIKHIGDRVVSSVESVSFPIAIVSYDGEKFDKILQVFDWCSYVGGTTVVYPNVTINIAKGLENGKPKSLSMTTTNIALCTDESNHMTNTSNYVRLYESGNIGDGSLIYDKDTNYCYKDSNIVENSKREAVIVASFKTDGLKITSFKPRPVGDPFDYYVLKTSSLMNYTYYGFKTYTNGVWGNDVYYAKNDIPSVGDEIYNDNYESIGTITEVGDQYIVTSLGTTLYRYFDEDIKD
jgi:hypothetical protein